MPGRKPLPLTVTETVPSSLRPVFGVTVIVGESPRSAPAAETNSSTPSSRSPTSSQRALPAPRTEDLKPRGAADAILPSPVDRSRETPFLNLRRSERLSTVQQSLAAQGAPEGL